MTEHQLSSVEQKSGQAKIRMCNSMSIECVLEFANPSIRERWVSLLEHSVAEINLKLGKGADDERALRHYDTAQTQTPTHAEQEEGNSLQKLGEYSVRIKKFEIAIEGTSSVVLPSRLINKQPDIIYLSATQPRQFNRKPEAKHESFRDSFVWVYALSFKNFRLHYEYRQDDADTNVRIQSMQIEDKSYDGTSAHQLRFPLLLKSQTARGKKEDVFRIRIKNQNY